jgi:uncharacterized protein DUF6886
VPRLFHVSDSGPLPAMTPRPSPAGTPQEGRPLVWAVDERHLPNYLVPRDCPRVCWAASAASGPLLASPAHRVVAVEHAWLPALVRATLHVHELDPAPFTVLDPLAGYWVSERDVAVRQVVEVADCPAALAARDVELRFVTSLWPYVDAVVAAGGEFSVIRARNARPREDAG